MNKKLMGGMIGLLLVMALAAIAQISANPVWSPPPPLKPTQGLGVDVVINADDLSLADIPLPTRVPASVKERNEIEQLQQSRAQENGESFKIPPREGRTPGDWKKYKDPNFNFVISYPANWLLQAPEGINMKKLPSHGYLVTIQNFENVVSKRDMKQNEMKIDLWLFPKTETYTSLEDWVVNKELFAPGTSYSDINDLSLPGKVAVTWSATGPMIPQGAKVIALEQQDRILILVAYPESSQFIWVLDAIFQSLD